MEWAELQVTTVHFRYYVFNIAYILLNGENSDYM